MPVLHIVIIGAGVAGLAVAQGLKKRNISFAVYERDNLLDSRRQGYRIKISGDLKAKLVNLLPAEVFEVLERTSAQTVLGETNINASDGSITACRRGRLPPNVPPPLTVDRGLLRHALMTGISEFVHFGHAFERYEEVAADSTGVPGARVFFTNGSSEAASLVLGVDGSRSRVRQQLIPGSSFIQDTSTCCVYGKTPLSDELQKQCPESYRRWLTVVRDEAPFTQNIIFRDGPVVMVSETCHFSNRDVYAHLPPDYVHWGIMFQPGMLRLVGKDLDCVLQDGAKLAVDLTADWHPSIRSLVTLQDISLTVGMRIYSAPVVLPAWRSSGVATILGDAAHTMSPAGGVGAVGALHDACGVVEMVEHEGISVGSIGRFEQGMRAFAGSLLQRTDAASRCMLGIGLAES
jgi:2-polyprenyl-6-methoxyphenol hydroxylase-like FAD-dependent oxidoreductase